MKQLPCALALALASLMVTAQGAGALTFTAGISPGSIDHAISPSVNPRAVAFREVTGDTNPDMLVATEGANALTWRFGLGTGSFSGTASVSYGGAPSDVITGEFSGDGAVYAALANRTSGTISTVGVGQLESVTIRDTLTLPEGTEPWRLASGDFDRDGDLDLVSVNQGTNDAVVLANDGDGNFTLGEPVSLGAAPTDVAVGDLNGDGRLDLAVAASAANRVLTLLGDGSGGFASPQELEATAAIAVDVGDFNDDGNRDLAVARRNGASGSVQLLAGDGGGSFTPLATSTSPSMPNEIVAFDLDADGDDDVVTANDDAEVAVHLGNGAGGLGAATAHAVSGGQIVDVTVADLNNDGLPDLGSAGSGGTVSALLGDGSGTLFGRPGSVFPLGTATPSIGGGQALRLGHVNDNSDANLDVIAAGSSLGEAAAVVLPGAGDGTLGPPTAHLMGASTGGAQVTIAVGDLNGDNNLDVATANATADNVTVRLGNGTGGFGAVSTYPAGDGAFSIALGDFDEANGLDIAVLSINDQVVTVRLNNGSGAFGSSQTFSVPVNARRIEAADLDGDGDDDLVALVGLIAGTARLQTYVSAGNGTFSAGDFENFPNASGVGGDVAVGDVNGDGDPDFAVVQGGPLITIVPGASGANLGSATNLDSPVNENPAAELADMDGDSDPDLVVPHNSQNSVSVLLNDDGAFVHDVTVPANGNFVRDVAVGDMNNDGDADLVTYNLNTSNLSVLRQVQPDSDPPDTRIEAHPDPVTEDATPSFSFASNEIGASFECSIDKGAASFGSCSGPGFLHTASQLAAGEWTFRVRAVDRAGNVDPTPATFDFEVADVVPPQTRVIKAKINKRKRTARFRFGSSEQGSSFRCKLDKQKFRPCSSPKAYRKLKPGRHVFRVAAIAPAGNRDASPARKRFRIPKR